MAAEEGCTPPLWLFGLPPCTNLNSLWGRGRGGIMRTAMRELWCSSHNRDPIGSDGSDELRPNDSNNDADVIFAATYECVVRELPGCCISPRSRECRSDRVARLLIAEHIPHSIARQDHEPILVRHRYLPHVRLCGQQWRYDDTTSTSSASSASIRPARRWWWRWRRWWWWRRRW